MRRLPVVLLVLALVLSACAQADPGTSAAPAEDTAVAAGPQAPGENPSAFDFSGVSLNGEAIEGGDFAGKDLMLWFWAPW